GALPAFMFFHGGGWVLGDYATHERLVRDLVAGSGATAVFVEYDRSPEAHYPVAINQAYAATKWVAAHGNEIGVDGRRLAAVGNSVGGKMAAVVSLMAKDRGTPNILFQILFWPVTNAKFDTASYGQFAEGHFLTRNMKRWFWDCYTTDPRERQDVYATAFACTTASPARAAPSSCCTVIRRPGTCGIRSCLRWPSVTRRSFPTCAAPVDRPSRTPAMTRRLSPPTSRP